MFFKKRQQKCFEKQLIDEFLEEHEKYIPTYSPEGMKLNWNIFVYKDGEHDMFTGEFRGEYKVGIKQKPPKMLSEDRTCYEYNIKTKKLEKSGLGWGI